MTLARQLIAERRARLSAERLLILKQEMSLANQKLWLWGFHAVDGWLNFKRF